MYVCNSVRNNILFLCTIVQTLMLVMFRNLTILNRAVRISQSLEHKLACKHQQCQSDCLGASCSSTTTNCTINKLQINPGSGSSYVTNDDDASDGDAEGDDDEANPSMSYQEEGSILNMTMGVNMEGSHVVLDSPNPYPRFPVSLPHRGFPTNMHSEAERLKTYEQWPISFLPPEVMARAGFYFTKRNDIVRCPFCGVEVCNWEREDDPWEDHRKWRSSCKFINNEPGHGNIPIGQETSLSQLSPSPNDSGYDTCGSQEIPGMDRFPEVAGVIQKSKIPAFPEYASLEKRQDSFSSWPVSLKIKPKILSDAGFYYTGKGDQTICFYCGGGLKDWEDSDDPWTEHAKWFSKCTFILLNKGEQFVENARKSITQGVKGNQQQSVEPEKEPVELKGSEPEGSWSTSCSSTAGGSSSGNSDAMLCKLCYNKPLEVVFLPCGHLMSCIDCSLKLSTCGVCRQPITGVVRTFLS